MLSFIAPLLYILFFTATLVGLTKRSFGKCLPISLMLSAFLLFFSQLFFGTFQVGFILGIIFAVLSVILLAIRIKKKQFSEFKKLYFTSGFVVFLTIYVAVFIYDLARGFSVWDEFSHWGVMVKEMLRLDKFYSVDASNLMVHKDYPPIMQLFEVFWVKLCGGGYKEACLNRALHTFELSLFVPFVAEKIANKWNAWKSVLIGFCSVLSISFVVLLFDQHGVFQAIYTDYVMALATVYLIMTILVNKKFTWFELATISLGGAFLILLKQMGMPLYLMVLCLAVVIVLIRKKVSLKKYIKEKRVWRLILAVVILVLPFIVWFIWGRMTADLDKQFSLSDISIGDFVKMILGRGGEDWQRFTTKKYIGALGQTSISTSFIPISYVQAIIMFVLALWVVHKFVKEKELSKKELIVLGTIVVLGAIGYAVAMLLLYTTAFGSYEGPILASYERYMGTYTIILFALIVMIIIWQATKNKNLKVIVLMIAVLALVSPPAIYSKLYPDIRSNEGSFAEYKKIAQKIKDTTGSETAKVFIVAQETVGAHYYLQYFADPIKINSLYYSWPIGEGVDEEMEYKSFIEPYLKDFDYLYVIDVNEQFINEYCPLVDFCPLDKGEIYKIDKSLDGTIKYNLVAEGKTSI